MKTSDNPVQSTSPGQQAVQKLADDAQIAREKQRTREALDDFTQVVKRRVGLRP